MLILQGNTTALPLLLTFGRMLTQRCMCCVLCRMVEAESGSITIDGIDIATLGLRHLRSQMSIIPQV